MSREALSSSLNFAGTLSTAASAVFSGLEATGNIVSVLRPMEYLEYERKGIRGCVVKGGSIADDQHHAVS